jgi:hypothetical protein
LSLKKTELDRRAGELHRHGGYGMMALLPDGPIRHVR